MSDIFLSYAAADRPRMITLVAALQNRGWVVWWDRTILPGKRWDDVIEAQLAATKCVIVVWSEQSVRSEWVRIEAEEAKQRGILAPALLDNVRIPLPFRRIQAANLVGWLGEADHPEFQELCRGVCAVTEASRESVSPIEKPAAAHSNRQRAHPRNRRLDREVMPGPTAFTETNCTIGISVRRVKEGWRVLQSKLPASPRLLTGFRGVCLSSSWNAQEP